MRRLITILGTASLLMALTTVPVDAVGHRPTIAISPRTSAIYLYDGSSSGTGPLMPAVTVKAVVRNCPPGDLWLTATLVQDGVSMPWATGALGAGEVGCEPGTSGGRPKPYTLSMGFYGATLHPGLATARFALVDLQRGGVVVAEATRTVHVPRTHGRCHGPRSAPPG